MFKKFIFITIVSSLLFSPLFLFPQNARAEGGGLSQLIIDEGTNLGIFTTVTQTAASAADAQRAITVPTFDVVQYSQIRAVEQAKAIKETKSNILQALAKIFLESLRKRLLDSLVDQIIIWIQGGGTPQFVTDWKGFLNNAFQAGVGDVVMETNAAFICSPFKLQVQLSLLPVRGFSQRINCTLDEIVANIEGFYDDFQLGGWLAYNTMWEPQNNYFGQTILIHDELLARTEKEREAAEKEALAGGGFLSVKQCVQYDEATGKCLKQQIVTPGDVVGQMTAKAVGSDIDYILNAGELEQYVAAITNAVINRVVQEGVSAIQESSSYEQNYSKTYEETITDIQRQEKERIIAEYQRVLDDRNVVLANKQQSASSTQQLVFVLNRLNGIACASSSSESEIAAAQSEADRLAGEISDIEGVIIEVEALKIEAESASPDYGSGDMEIVTQHYNEFNTKYGYAPSTLLLEVYSGSGMALSEAEFEEKEEALADAEDRLTSCGLSL